MSFVKSSIIRTAASLSLVGLAGWNAMAAQDPGYREPVHGTRDSNKQKTGVPAPGKGKAEAAVSLNATDITIKTAVTAIAQQAGLKVIYDSEAPLNKKLRSVKLDNVPALKALEAVLKGTGVVVSPALDGQTVILKSGGPKDSVTGQQLRIGTVFGRVIDAASKHPIANATVTISGTGSVITDKNGNFHFSGVSIGTRTVKVRLLGYSEVSQLVDVVASGKHELALSLNYVPERLREVVTTGAGDRQRVEVGNSITRIDADSIMRTMPVMSLEDLIKSRSPGTQVLMSGGSVGSGSRIRVRGVSGLLTNSDPIVIVDGIRIDATYSQVSGGAPFAGDVRSMGKNQLSSYTQAASRINDIDPSTIESIEILKGPSASSLYGSDAANGVIVIKTKRGAVGPAKWSVSGETGVSTLNTKFAETHFAWGSSDSWAVSQNCSLADMANGVCVQDSITKYNPLNVKESSPFGTGHNRQYSVNVSGGASQMRYFLGYTNRNDVGLLKMPESEKERLLAARNGNPIPVWAERPNVNRTSNVTANISTDVSDRLSANMDMRFISGYHRDASQGGISFIRAATEGPGYRDSIGKGWGMDGPALDFLKRQSDAVKGASGGLNTTFRPSDRIVLNAVSGMDFSSRQDESLLRQEDLVPGTFAESQRGRYDGQVITRTSSVSGVFELPLIGGMTSRSTIGAQFNKSTNNSVTVIVNNLTPGRDVLDAGTVSTRPTEERYESATRGWYIDQFVRIRDNLFATAAIRGDAGSAFGREAKPMLYPKFNTSWVVSNESFFPKNTFLTNLRLRGAFGQAGVQPGPVARFRSFTSSNVWVDGRQQGVFSVISMGNTHLIPERSMEFEGGFEAGMWNDRIVFDATSYYKRVKNALTSRPLPSSFGLAARQENLGDVKNTGTELSVTVRPLDVQSVAWSFSTSYSKSRNVLERLGAKEINSGYSNVRFVEGYPLHGFWGRPLLAYADGNGDGIITLDEIQVGDSAVYLGSPVPASELSFFNNLSFLSGKVLLSTGFSYTNGMTQLNAVAQQQCYLERCASAIVPGTSLAQQALVQTMFNNNGPANTFATTENVSWLRWNSISLTVAGTPAMAKLLKSRSVSLSLMGRNIGLWSNYSGPDPEVNSTSFGNMTSDAGTMPQTRDWSVRINLGF